MPLIRMVFNIPPEIIILIQKDSNKVVFSLESTYTDMNTTNTSLKEVFIKSMILKPLLMSKDLVPLSDKINTSTGGDNYNNQKAIFECLCVPESSLITNKSINSGVLRNVTVTEAILALMSKVDSKLFLSPPDNNERYRQIPLVPGNLYTNLYHIDRSLGIYNTNLEIFTSYDRIIISPSISEYILNDSTISVSVSFDVDNPLVMQGSYTESDMSTGMYTKNIQVSSKSVGSFNDTELFNELMGSKTYFSSSDIVGRKENINARNIEDRLGAINKTVLFEDIYNNPHNRSNFINKTSNRQMLSIRFEQIDIDLLDGFRKFAIKFENVNHSDKDGIYNPISVTHEFTTNDKQVSSLVTIINMQKMN